MKLIVISKEELEDLVQSSVQKVLVDFFAKKEIKAKKGEFITVKIGIRKCTSGGKVFKV